MAGSEFNGTYRFNNDKGGVLVPQRCNTDYISASPPTGPLALCGSAADGTELGSTVSNLYLS